MARIKAINPVKNVRLLAVSKSQSSDAIRALAGLGQYAFGENYMQEALQKQNQLTDLNLDWHFIGPLQSNKSQMVAENFAWLQSLDRAKLIDALARFRASFATPLQVLLQVKVDNEESKSGAPIEQIMSLAQHINDAGSSLNLRGLMCIPFPHDDIRLRVPAFTTMRELFLQLRDRYPQCDTLSMGMSDDFELAIEHGATMVRIGSALFGARPSR